ncbi:MAG: isochorismatase family protein [Streptosporangiaceae bacterium]
MTADGTSQSADLQAVRDLYRSHGVGGRVGFGAGCAVLVVDFQQSYTRTWRAKSLTPVENTARVLEAARRRAVPVIYTYMGYDPAHPDAGVWGMKAATLVENLRGSEACRIDPLIEPRAGDAVLEKRVPSAFFGSGLAERLHAQGVDTVVVCGSSTSGCVRATVVDGLSHGFRVIVPEDCVSDASAPSAEVALADIDTKYGDVVTSAEVLEQMRAPRARQSGETGG